MNSIGLGSSASSATGFHVMAKPSGPACNLACDYCFYLEKEILFPERKPRRMSGEVLEAYVRNTIASTPAGSPVLFAWQGGEPTLLGLDFYKSALHLQRKYGAGREIENSFQTNGTLIDDDWARFLAENHFLVGLSLDGPQHVHDRYRRYRSGAGSHGKVMAALERLQRHGAEFNVLACVDRHSSQYPQETYRFFKQLGIGFIQFTPIVERLAAGSYAEVGFDLQGPRVAGNAGVAPFAVRPRDWGTFLATVFDDWLANDVGKTFVMNIEWTLAALLDQPGVVCVHQRECGRAIATEHNGDVYSCDHFVYPEYKLGNLTEHSLAALVDSPRQQAFGRAKWQGLPAKCTACPVLKACWGGCPKQRFLTTSSGEPGLNYLCEGYELYLGHAAPALLRMGELLRAGREPSEIMREAGTRFPTLFHAASGQPGAIASAPKRPE